MAAAIGLPFGDRGGPSTVPLNSVAAIDPSSGKVVVKTAVGIDPQAVTVGAGSVWVANTTDRTVSRVAPDSGQVEQTVAVGVYPSDLVVAPNAVDVVSAPLGQLVQVDPARTDASQPRGLGHACGGVDASIAVGSGSLWIACDRDPGAFRVSLDGRRVVPFAQRAGLLEAPTAELAPHFTAIAYGDGVTWIADRGQDRVLRVHAATTRPLPPAVEVGSDPVAIAVGFGSVWVASTDGTVSRIRPGGAALETVTVGDRPAGIAAGEGAVWVANAGSNSVSRIDPATNRVTRTIDLHNPPAGVAVGSGRVWVTVAEEE